MHKTGKRDKTLCYKHLYIDNISDCKMDKWYIYIYILQITRSLSAAPTNWSQCRNASKDICEVWLTCVQQYTLTLANHRYLKTGYISKKGTNDQWALWHLATVCYEVMILSLIYPNYVEIKLVDMQYICFSINHLKCCKKFMGNNETDFFCAVLHPSLITSFLAAIKQLY